MSKLMPSPRVETANRREPSGLSAAEAYVLGESSSGGPIVFCVFTSESTAVPSAAAVMSVPPSGVNAAELMRPV